MHCVRNSQRIASYTPLTSLRPDNVRIRCDVWIPLMLQCRPLFRTSAKDDHSCALLHLWQGHVIITPNDIAQPNFAYSWYQVTGNMWKTYLELIMADYSEWWVESVFTVCLWQLCATVKLWMPWASRDIVVVVWSWRTSIWLKSFLWDVAPSCRSDD